MFLADGMDYSSDTEANLTFTMNNRELDQLCLIVTIIGDNLIDGNETLEIFFQLSTQDTLLGGSNVTITIIDDVDCEYNLDVSCLYIYIFLLFILLSKYYNQIY